MRYSPEHKIETHARIVKKASARLRERGAHGVGVADLMKDAGLTHGGFYSHFASRDALMVEAISFAMDRSIDAWRRLSADAAPTKRFETLVESYLTPGHRDAVGTGCAIPSLGADIARESPRTRKAFAAKLEEMIGVLAQSIPNSTPKTARRQAMAALSTMVGSLLMARIAGNGELSEAILSAGKEAILAGARTPKTAGGASAAAKVRKAKTAV
jgi:TetR/AcrR family transcriptional repressor of nem operon